MIDTIDLQNHDAPSAKDHTRQPTHPQSLGNGPAGPHQAQTLRNAEQEALNDQLHSPQMHHNNHMHRNDYQDEPEFYDDQDDSMHQELNGHSNGDHATQNEDSDVEGQSEDEAMDDDLMDKISSSPSIDDGNYSLPVFLALKDRFKSPSTRWSLSWLTAYKLTLLLTICFCPNALPTLCTRRKVTESSSRLEQTKLVRRNARLGKTVWIELLRYRRSVCN